MKEEKQKVKKITELDRGTMKQVLGMTDVFAVGYGDLGSSIYYALGVTALFALGATPIALALAGLIFACTALSYAEMSSMRLASGGSSSFTRFAINDFVSFIAGWALLLDFIVTIAISAFSSAPYLSFFFPILKLKIPQIIFTTCVIFALFILNFFGSKNSTRISWFLTISTLLTQVVIIAVASYYFVDLKELFHHLKIGQNTLWSPTWGNFFKGTAMAMVAYTGIESMAQLVSETKRPSKTVPRAIMIVTVVLVLMYFGISAVALSVLTPQALSTTYLEDPIAGIVSGFSFGKSFLGPWIGVLGAVLLIVAANAGLIGASRVAFRMGEFHQLPRFLYKLHPKFKTPFIALFIFGLLASLIVILSFGNINYLADLYNFGATLAFASTHLSLIRLRITQPDLERPFKISFSIPIGKGRSIPISALFGLVATFSVWLSVVIFKPQGRYLGLVWLFVGILMYIFYRKQKNIDPIATLQIEKVDIPDYKELKIKKILVPTRGGVETMQIAADLAKLHGSDLLAIYVIDVPFSMSIHTPLYFKMKQAELVLKRAEAIAQETGVSITTKVIRSRSISKTILELAKEEGADLIILGSPSDSRKGIFGAKSEVIDEIVKNSPCKVLVGYGN